MPSERKVDQHYVDTLVESTELCLLSAEMVMSLPACFPIAPYCWPPKSDSPCSLQRPNDFDKNAGQVRFLFTENSKSQESKLDTSPNAPNTGEMGKDKLTATQQNQ